eukprot:EG_transcript_2693
MQPTSQLPLEYKYSRLKVLGKGSFGEAILVRSKEDSRHYVAKEINLLSMSPKEKEDAKNEIRVLAQLSHPNIIKLHDHLMHRARLYIIMEWADGGDLDMKIKKARQEGQRFDEDRIMFWFVQLCLSIKHLHDKKILHRDLKAGNVFLMSSGIIKLGDFGISTVLRNTLAQAMTVCGTPYYFSPEICKNKPYNNKSDIWALGCIFYEMVTLQHPFNGRNIYELMKSICSGLYAPLPPPYGPYLTMLLGKMLNPSPSNRLSIDNLLRLDFVQDHLRKLKGSSLYPTEDRGAGPSQPPPKAQEWLADKPEAERAAGEANARREREERAKEKEREREQRQRERERREKEREQRERERDKVREEEAEKEKQREVLRHRERLRELQAEERRQRARSREDVPPRDPSPLGHPRGGGGDLGAVFQAMEKKTPLQQLEEWRQKERDRERERERLPDANPIEPLQQVRTPPREAGARPQTRAAPQATEEWLRKEYWERRQEAERNRRRLYQDHGAPLPLTPPHRMERCLDAPPEGRRLSEGVADGWLHPVEEGTPSDKPDKPRRRSDGFRAGVDEDRLASAAAEALGRPGDRRRGSGAARAPPEEPPSAIERELAEAQQNAFRELRREADRNKQRIHAEAHIPLRDPKWDDPKPHQRHRVMASDPALTPLPDPTADAPRKLPPKPSEEEELIKMLSEAVQANALPKADSAPFLGEDEDIPEELPQEARDAMTRQAEQEYATMRGLVDTILDECVEEVPDEEFGDDEPLM